jgi:hypothetical protein
MDGYMILHTDFVRQHKAAARKGWFVQGSRVWLGSEDVDKSIREDSGMPPLLRRRNILNSISSKTLSRLFSRRSRSLEGIKSCNMAFWRYDCFAVNGFNEDFTGWGREDSEFAVRLMNRGIKRRNLRFGGVAYHLSHPQESRAQLAVNEMILERAIRERLDYCSNGLVKVGTDGR